LIYFRWAGPRKGEIQGHLWRTRPDLRRDVRLLKKSSIILQISQIFSFANFIFSRFFTIKSRNFAALLFCTFSPPFPKPFKKNEIILFSHGSFWMRWYLPLREINFASIFNQFAASQFLKEFFVSEKTFHLFLISRLQFFLRESAKK